MPKGKEAPMSATQADSIMRPEITDSDLGLMRNRCGYPNPTVRSGTRQLPWWTVTSVDALRHHVNGYGDDNPLYTDPDYAASTRWGGLIGPPGFGAAGGPNAHRELAPRPYGDDSEVQPGQEKEAWLRRLGTRIPESLDVETRKALRGVQLYASGSDRYFYRPLRLGDYTAGSAGGVWSVESKLSQFAGRSAIVGNRDFLWNQDGEVTSMMEGWLVHAARKKVETDEKKVAVEPAWYSDEQLSEIEAAYDAEYRRGADTLFYEDVNVGDELPTMVKGPLHLTDMFNQHMGDGWFGYGNPALRLGHENRKKMRGFYSRTAYNSWDVIQRVHWDEMLAREVGVELMYDIAPMRMTWAIHYCTNFMGDDAWLYHLRTELRKFNYFGDTTWYSGRVVAKHDNPELGPAIGIEISGINQRGIENTRAEATILVSSRDKGSVILPSPEPEIAARAREIKNVQSSAKI
jgi:acyl dehydratase